jgi:two-component system chemotaxis response regulator CheY
MALDTKPRVFGVYAPGKPAAMSEHESEGGAGDARTRVIGSGGSRVVDSHEGQRERRTGGATVTAPSAVRQLSADVLVVDDDEDVRWTVAEVLRSAGLSVAEAEDGEVALELLNSHRYRMVLLDLRMPHRGGVSLIEAVPDVPPVVVHSAYSLDAAERQRLGDRVVDYLHKPVSPQKLLRAVDAVLGTGHGT